MLHYPSKEFKELTSRHGITLSMSDKGYCYDNAVAESFFHTLKTEEVHLKHYRTKEEAKAAIFEYVEVFYNRERIHSGKCCFGKTPMQTFLESKHLAKEKKLDSQILTANEIVK